MAPELLEDPEGDVAVRSTKYSDIYSFGGIMLLVCLRKFQSPIGLLTGAPLLGSHRKSPLLLLPQGGSSHQVYIQREEA
jgi:serine/threonine protein kinase